MKILLLKIFHDSWTILSELSLVSHSQGYYLQHLPIENYVLDSATSLDMWKVFVEQTSDYILPSSNDGGEGQIMWTLTPSLETTQWRLHMRQKGIKE